MGPETLCYQRRAAKFTRGEKPIESKRWGGDHLNNLLTIELTAINQYFVQAEMCKNWGFERLYKGFRSTSMEEMEDAQRLIRYILYLEGIPTCSVSTASRCRTTPPEASCRR